MRRKLKNGHKKLVDLSIDLNSDLLSDLKKIAKQRNKSVEYLVIEILKDAYQKSIIDKE